ncbi:synaptic vesicle glycoprotein 2C-like isoform X1 [Drosophila sulfurigaster albostrigata]|uniref:synaptic vesicle glycoprotein 2C-like isoform X1 n=1 Tax=Drosophila sulfurigaster albostrigata TaxID=89887 RepID=UPI002D21CFC8|nr:synaptic vesicle glycoprotein 2C-like isoform X1 [Drosophila sulfurigaster albostrigata]
MPEANIDDVLNALGFGRMQLIIFFSCATQQMYVANEQFGLGLVSVAASCDFAIDDHRMAWLISAVFVAQVCSSHYMGYKSDEIGRRKLLVISSALSMIASFISSLMPDFWSFLVMRFIVGCFLTGPGMALVTYMSEFTKVALRPTVVNFISYSVGVSMIYMPLMAMWLFPLKFEAKIWEGYNFTSWRVLILINLLPGVLSWIAFLIMPESPKYLLSINQPAKALEVLEMCCRYNKGKEVTLKSLGFESVSQPRLRSEAAPQHKFLLARMWYETVPLFQGIYLNYMLLILVILYIFFATGFGLTVWVPRIVNMEHIVEEELILCDLVEVAEAAEEAANSTLSESKCTISTTLLLGSIFNGCSCLGMSILVTLLLLCLRRKVILLLFTIIAVLAGFLLNFIITPVVLLSLFIFLSVPPLCSLRLTITVLIDVIPTHMRSKAVALAMMFGRIGVLTASLFVGYTLKWNCFVTFNSFVLALLICCVLITRLPSERDIVRLSNK